MFLCPMERCTAIHEYVRLDQSFAECAQEHQCSRPEHECPLRMMLADAAEATSASDVVQPIRTRRAS